jgi:hypothetical protein
MFPLKVAVVAPIVVTASVVRVGALTHEEVVFVSVVTAETQPEPLYAHTYREYAVLQVNPVSVLVTAVPISVALLYRFVALHL